MAPLRAALGGSTVEGHRLQNLIYPMLTTAGSRCVVMDVETFRTIHRYGALLSVVAMVGAVPATVIGGPLTPLIFPLGFFGPLAGFYFIGGVLEDHPRYRVLGEELLRGVVWYAGSLIGWAFILTESSLLAATPVTALGLPALTALGLSLGMVATRQLTGLDLKVQSEGGQLLVAITGAIVGGFVVLYVVLVDGRSPLLAIVYLFATVGGFLIWRRHWHRERQGG